MENRKTEMSFERSWPRIARYLEVDSTGYVQSHFHRWDWWVRDTLSSADLAASYEEWADFFELRLAQPADELARDRIKRHAVDVWTDDMVYCCRRAAAFARGEDPGEWVPLWERRPDLDATGRAIVDEIIARLPGVTHGRAVSRGLVGAEAA